MEDLVKASAAEAEAISAALAAAKARQNGGEYPTEELPDTDTNSSPKLNLKNIQEQASFSYQANSRASEVRLHHRAVS
jgi:hypothetical protein